MDPLDGSFLQALEKKSKDRGNVLLLTIKPLLCNCSESSLLHNMQESI